MLKSMDEKLLANSTKSLIQRAIYLSIFFFFVIHTVSKYSPADYLLIIKATVS